MYKINQETRAKDDTLRMILPKKKMRARIPAATEDEHETPYDETVVVH